MIEKVMFLGQEHPAHLNQSDLKQIEDQTGFSIGKLIAEVAQTGNEYLIAERLFDSCSLIAFRALKSGCKKQSLLFSMGVISELINSDPLIDKIESFEQFEDAAGISDCMPIAMKMVINGFKGVSPNIPSDLPKGQEAPKKKSRSNV